MLLVLFVLVVSELVAVRLWDKFHTVEPNYLDRSPAPITEEQKQFVVDLVQASGIVDRINGVRFGRSRTCGTIPVFAPSACTLSGPRLLKATDRG
jgi:hypothetical protein